MSKVTLDQAIQQQLNADWLELCDSLGNTVGYYLSAAEYRKLLYERAKAAVTKEELDRAEGQPGGMTTAELLVHLEILDRTPTGAA